MGKKKVSYWISKLRALRAIPHIALGVKAGFEIRERERNKKFVLLETGTTFQDRKKKKK